MTEATPPSGPILVPVDFSDHSAAALAWAIEAARATGAPLLVTHAVHDPEDAPGYYTRVAGHHEPELINDAAQLGMDAFVEAFRAAHPESADFELDTLMVTGIPASRIVEVAERVDARQIVMGSQGRTRLARLLLGSKAQSVVQMADIPVTIVKFHPPADDA